MRAFVTLKRHLKTTLLFGRAFATTQRTSLTEHIAYRDLAKTIRFSRKASGATTRTPSNITGTLTLYALEYRTRYNSEAPSRKLKRYSFMLTSAFRTPSAKA